MQFTAGARRNGSRNLHRIVGSLQHRSRFGEERLSSFRQVNGLRAALKQREPKLFLEVMNLAAERRLRNMQLQRRPRNILRFGSRNKVAQMTKLHAAAAYFLTMLSQET